MQDRLDIGAYQHDGRLIILGSSTTPEWTVIHEMPPEILADTASDEALGQAVLAAANRCRGTVNEPASIADETAKQLGFKSWADKQKKPVYASVSRRHGADHLDILPVRKANKSGTTLVFTETAFKAPIAEPEKIGATLREALKLSAEWKNLPPLK